MADINIGAYTIKIVMLEIAFENKKNIISGNSVQYSWIQIKLYHSIFSENDIKLRKYFNVEFNSYQMDTIFITIM